MRMLGGKWRGSRRRRRGGDTARNLAVAGGKLAAQLRASVHGVAQTPAGALPHAFHGPSRATRTAWRASTARTAGRTRTGSVYGPDTNLEVPAHALVTMTIDQYDTGGTIDNAYFAGVHGTLGGTETSERQDGYRISAATWRTHSP